MAPGRLPSRSLSLARGSTDSTPIPRTSPWPRRRAAAASLDGRVRFAAGDAGRLAAAGSYDLVILDEPRPATP
jgi:hypothetical protein